MERLFDLGRLPQCALVLALLGLPLGACVKDRVATTGSIVPPAADYRERHPIVLAEAPVTLDVFPRDAYGLDRRQQEDVHAFAAAYDRSGKGVMTVMVPAGRRQTHRTLTAIRGALAQAGVHGQTLVVVSYRPDDPLLAAPIRLKYESLQAKVASECGQWPTDLSGGPSTIGWHNRSYENFGCATQTNFANQIADPIDLVRGRQETPVDTRKRLNAIGKIRNGQDPSTTYKEKAVSTQDVGGN